MHHLQDPQIRDKISSTNLQRYGFTNPGSNPDVEFRRIQTNQFRYGVSNPMENSAIVEKSLRGRLHISRCIFPENIKSKSIDAWNRYYRGFDEDNNSMIRYIDDTIVYPWESYQKMLDLLCPKKTISADDCSMLMIYKRVAASFLNRYDLYGNDRRNELCIGLVYQDKLIQVMTIGKSKDLDHTYQIYRLCTCPGFHIQDGVKKMFRYAVKDFEVNDVIAYHSTRFNAEFESIGMTKSSMTKPIKIWYHHDLMIPDDQIFDRDLKKMFDDSKGLEKHNWQSISIDPFEIWSYLRSEN